MTLLIRNEIEIHTADGRWIATAATPEWATAIVGLAEALEEVEASLLLDGYQELVEEALAPFEVRS